MKDEKTYNMELQTGEKTNHKAVSPYWFAFVPAAAFAILTMYVGEYGKWRCFVCFGCYCFFDDICSDFTNNFYLEKNQQRYWKVETVKSRPRWNMDG